MRDPFPSEEMHLMEKDVLILAACVRVCLPVEGPFSQLGLMAWQYPIINAMTSLWPLLPRPANGEENGLNFFRNLIRWEWWREEELFGELGVWALPRRTPMR